MQDYQINRLMMFRAVSDYLDANAEIINSIPALTELASTLKNKVSEIENAADKHSTVSKGKTNAKLEVQERLVMLVKAVGSALLTYAKQNNKPETATMAAMREWRFRSLRDEEQLRHATVILGQLDAAAVDLVRYGITTGVLEDYRATVQRFERAILDRDASVSERTVTHGNIAALILECGRLLAEELDHMMQMIRVSHPGFYDGYKSIRITKSLAVRYRKNSVPVEEEAAPSPEPSTETFA